MSASALVAAVGDGKQFGKGRDLAAWLGLTPREHSSGGKQRLGDSEPGRGLSGIGVNRGVRVNGFNRRSSHSDCVAKRDDGKQVRPARVTQSIAMAHCPEQRAKPLGRFEARARIPSWLGSIRPNRKPDIRKQLHQKPSTRIACKPGGVHIRNNQRALRRVGRAEKKLYWAAVTDTRRNNDCAPCGLSEANGLGRKIGRANTSIGWVAA